MYEHALSARLSKRKRAEEFIAMLQIWLKKKKDRKTWILHYMGPFTCSCFYPAGASLCGVNISTPCLCKCPEGAEDTQVGSTGDHTASSHECQCECTCYMCVTHVTGSKHVHAWHPVHAGKHSNPFRSPLAHQKMDGRSDQCQIPCACVVDGALMALKSNRFSASLMIFERWHPQTFILQCHWERAVAHTQTWCGIARMQHMSNCWERGKNKIKFWLPFIKDLLLSFSVAKLMTDLFG